VLWRGDPDHRIGGAGALRLFIFLSDLHRADLVVLRATAGGVAHMNADNPFDFVFFDATPTGSDQHGLA
jgi:hypothetical protein